MHWRWLIPLPLAALLCGEAVHAPRLREPLPVKSTCYGYSAAKERYLLAYGFAADQPKRAAAYLEEMQKLLDACPNDEAARTLIARAASLKSKIHP